MFHTPAISGKLSVERDQNYSVFNRSYCRYSYKPHHPLYYSFPPLSHLGIYIHTYICDSPHNIPTTPSVFAPAPIIVVVVDAVTPIDNPISHPMKSHHSLYYPYRGRVFRQALPHLAFPPKERERTSKPYMVINASCRKRVDGCSACSGIS